MRRRLHLPVRGSRRFVLAQEFGGEERLKRFVITQLVKGDTWDIIGAKLNVGGSTVEKWCDKWHLTLWDAGRVVLDGKTGKEFWPSNSGVIECIAGTREGPE